ncbi:MAG: phage tail protein [Campylobacter sp.]|uniref:phage tail sheath subtilisin-like domain-containing protein n=1 Tax=Campylobacter concisus TaxID=199 RepID=UPI000D304FAC|nr:phage tail sheath subtilisin-like domain-containing protein [Campylobacter concisus]RKV90312.1 MAG: phage tail protein [Campylobacter sp.]DAM74833.1 MAG TPA: tail sheath tube [Caudoviricetes sp.]DAN20013.1 MAG TPA: tail sheath tube [Caudoviricetes sp.]DAR71712.1 MAG TPA: tail sheath tube [Caudoviricetes sp.]DAR72138.1 MAG TPA: tail sheath tube [Caudoviricetes sp.]
MAAKFGVNVTVSAEAARPIAVESTTPIGIAGYEEVLENGLHFYMTTAKALEALEAKYKAKKDASQAFKKGSIYRALKGIEDQAVNTQIILSVFTKDDDEDTNDEITECKSAVTAFAKAKSRFGYSPNLIIAPGFSHEDAIKGEIEKMATRLKATGIVDLKADDAAAAIVKMGDFGTNRLVAAYPNVKVWDDETNAYVYEGQSARIAGMIAHTDGASEFGYSDSYSNRVMIGVSGTQIDVDFELGETCTADELRAAKISTIIRESGFRAWGGETSDQDTIWQDLARVRIFDRISQACQKGVLFAIDRKASELYHAKRSVSELLRQLVGAKVLLGYELSWSAKNTDATITAGKFYLDVRMQNNPIVKQLTLDFIYVDKYGSVLMDELNK